MTTGDPSGSALAETVRREAAPITAALHRLTGDFDVAEEAVQDALVAALTAWRRDGIPPNPGGWLMVTARRKAIDRLRRASRERRTAGLAGAEPAAAAADEGSGQDERVPMLFGCCHPALAVEARLALTLRAVVGLTTEQIARAFLVPEATLAQRIVRAKRKIVPTGSGWRSPPPTCPSAWTTC